ncbi:MAG: hypothetical protein A2X28_01570 [Elusimicrobia bacterium GWA2_56_46]|nr:MAG: hypothetical protein A2X28_01570 [Elusimicrobia bacterium GWA2_56_46]OGR53846.1 MAG: hypothetical protein A2X39_06970 [Elusimicrobia bacterium GWC2_56_31]HBB68317.1 hypothetical protein [Elusimicrobiota bacterium]HBW22698.1 hypothetical protein [Elusimicrobiota bacterium]
MTDFKEENFGEHNRLAVILRATDFSSKSKIKISLKNRLLSKAANEEKRSFTIWAWLLPAAAVTLAALMLTVNINHKEVEQSPYYQAPDADYNIYGNCGRQGLEDYLSAPRF